MKRMKYILSLILVAVFLSACNEGIDSISRVDPGPDASAPVVTIKYPVEGTSIQVPELVASINIQFEATDDIELGSVKIILDGTELKSYNEFKDYRRALVQYQYDNVTSGSHTLVVRATDKEGKTTDATVNFEKKPPYTPVYAGETFYMPFDGDYVEKISFKSATVVGSPGFAGTALKGLNAYAGATDSYLSFPLAGLNSSEFTAEFWYKVNATPDRAGIISISPTGDSRNSGLRFFREGNATSQQFKLNMGTGAGETWNDGGSVAIPADGWIHLAFTVSSTECTVYINGAAVRTAATTPIDWTGCDAISIASGAPNFIYWDHKSDLSDYDEMRFFNRALTAEEIQNIIQNDSPYVPKYNGEVFYMPFEGNYKEKNSNINATEVGTPGFETGKVGQAYAGAADSYLTFPTTELVKSNELSAVFWMKVNASPDRAGILVMGPEDTANAGFPDVQNKRTNGFRFFREGSATSQQLKVNVGLGASESWNDGGLVDPTTGDWVHVAFVISGTKSSIYINGELAREATYTGGIDWTGCDLLQIMSGAPRFTEWNHFSDQSLMDELRIFNRALSQDEIKTIMDNEK